MMPATKPLISWDWGTAYDLFASLHVLHHPEVFGLRGSWAAGVRSRLTAPQRGILEDSQRLFFSSPLAWVSNLPAPKDATTALRALDQIEQPERLPMLAFHADEAPEVFALLNEVKARQAWSDLDLEKMKLLQQHKESPGQADAILTSLNWWAHADEFGERYLDALQAYVEVFFAEEERRIQPYISQALHDAQQLAAELDFSNLFVELSQGVKIAAFEDADEIKLVPSYWTTPLVMYDCLVEKHWVVLFGARPAEVALVPGDVVPDAMLRVLKALSDPTRLLILRYLSDKSQTPTQLARRLRLRPPTVIHHLNALRLAGLVYVTLEEEEEKRYTVREATITDTFDSIHGFLQAEGER